jgi:hypothetical protein
MMKPWQSGHPLTDISLSSGGAAFSMAQDWLAGKVVRFRIDANGTYKVKLRHSGKVRWIYWNATKGVHIKVAPKVRRTTCMGKTAVVTDGNIWVTSNPVLVEIL